ncbi:conserved hypothetical protein [Histoplasma capsulatum G186AR]|uniref:Uncharacterized protein n=1 Tax=Ajellomyces capsulatus (strain G186AR / H82 / ATCC MYA-2454 / RMSCC 2432) TaxID=447093 RepID=C0NA34_AJECG|nr:uncharacterized protein HCBG_01193 [Histoplasma capsulatum G186AR]EEH11738.1 conserved hypothetical protein [Histoplasma capsulatum G186AR]
MEPSIPVVGRRVATVSDMIQWLWHDGFYRGEVGWSAEWDPGAIFGTPNSTSGPYVFGVSTLCGEKAGRPLHLEPNVDKISDVAVEGAANAGSPETLYGDAHAKYVKTMIRQHKKLLPDALQEIDQRLLKAGVSAEEVTSLTNGRATDAYKKLARLDQVTGKCSPSSRLQFRVIYDILPGEWKVMDVYLPRTCRLGDFEDTMLRHRLVLDLRHPTSLSYENLPENLGSPPEGSQSGAESRILTKKPGLCKKVWAYKIAEGDQSDTERRNFEGWKALCDEQDFTDLMQALLKDGSKEAKMAIEITLETAKRMIERQSETEVYKKSTFYTWDGELDNSSDMGEANSNMAVDGCMPIADVFDWSQLIDEEVAQWEEDSPN